MQGDPYIPPEGLQFRAYGGEGIYILPAHAQAMSTTEAAEALFGIWGLMLSYGSQTCTYQIATQTYVPIGSIEVFVAGLNEASGPANVATT